MHPATTASRSLFVRVMEAYLSLTRVRPQNVSPQNVSSDSRAPRRTCQTTRALAAERVAERVKRLAAERVAERVKRLAPRARRAERVKLLARRTCQTTPPPARRRTCRRTCPQNVSNNSRAERVRRTCQTTRSSSRSSHCRNELIFSESQVRNSGVVGGQCLQCSISSVRSRPLNSSFARVITLSPGKLRSSSAPITRVGAVKPFSSSAFASLGTFIFPIEYERNESPRYGTHSSVFVVSRCSTKRRSRSGVGDIT